MLHQEHPPLGKLLIAIGTGIFGDNPLGWRAMSAIFGSLTLVAMFLWSLALFGDLARSLWITAITFFNQIIYVQSRIAMLDIFLMAFCTLSLAFFTLSLKERQESRSLGFAILMGVSLGLATACKWSGMFLLFGIVMVALLLGLLRGWRVRFEDPREADFFRPDIWTAITPSKAVMVLGLIPLLTYFSTYVPQMIHAGSILEFVDSHRRMYEIMSGNSGTHPYSSQWFEWPAMTRPVWYLFHLAGNDFVPWSAQNQAQAVLAIANPVVLITGEIAVVFGALRWIVTRDINAMIVTVGFFSQYLPWAVNPKGLEFFFYYFPSILCVGPALGLVLFRDGLDQLNWPAIGLIGAAGLCFAFFMPVLTAHVGVSPGRFDSLIWFPSWR
jgi:dolichyl-phosphate-mannose-protein mannosyltransferase